MSPQWTQQLAKSLSSGRVTPGLEIHLDLLLAWLSDPDNPRAAELDRAIGGVRLNRDQAITRAYQLLDRLLFDAEGPPSAEGLGIAADAPPTLAKQRYRRLVRVYHPDRHPNRTVWATRRTEQVNRAFDAYRKGVRAPSRPAAKPGWGATTRPRATVPPPAWRPEVMLGLITLVRDWARRAYADLSQGQRAMLAGAVVALLLIAVFVARVGEPPKRIPKIIHHPLNTVEPITARLAPAVTSPRQGGPAYRPAPEPSRSTAETDAEAPYRPETIPSPPPTAEAARSSALATSETTAGPVAPPSERPAITATVAEPAPQTPTATPPESATAVDRPSITSSEATSALPMPESAEPAMESSEPLPPPQTFSPEIPPEPPLFIPPAAPPSAPEPPAAPELPLRISAAPVMAPSLPEVTAPPVGCASVPEQLRRFQLAYQAGALDQLMALYSPRAKENTLATWFAIRQTYAEWFGKTSARQISFDRLQIKPIPNSDRCAVSAVFKVIYRDGQTLPVTKTGVIQLLFDPKGSELLILRVRY